MPDMRAYACGYAHPLHRKLKNKHVLTCVSTYVHLCASMHACLSVRVYEYVCDCVCKCV